jgi:hypothetical protein
MILGAIEELNLFQISETLVLTSIYHVIALLSMHMASVCLYNF